MSQGKKPEVYQYQTIVAATRQGTEWFDTLEEMPTVLRATCMKALDNPEAMTILIANHEGLAAWKSAIERNKKEAEQEQAAQATQAATARERERWVIWMDAAAVAAGALGLLAMAAYWWLRR